MSRRFVAGALVGALLLALASVVPAVDRQSSRSYWLEAFDADVQVTENGSVDVTETLRFFFDGSFNGIYRDIPVDYRTPWGLDYDLRVTLLSVTDAGGQALRHETSTPGRDVRFKVWVPGAQDAARTVVLRYRVERAIRFLDDEDGFPAHDELYWNVTGTRWQVPILSASARVRLPEAVVAEPDVRAYTGPYGSRESVAAIEHAAPNDLLFEVADRLEPGEGLSIVVGWPPGAVRRPTVVDAARTLIIDNWPLATPLLVLVGMVWSFRRWGRDPDLNRSVMVQYEPPDGLRPAEIGVLTDEKVDLRDIVATVIDLAVRGHLRIEEKEERGWLLTDTDTYFERIANPGDRLTAYERIILDGLFESGDRVEMDALKNKFYKHVGTVKDSLYDDLTRRGFFRAGPDRVRKMWILLAVVTLAVFLVPGFVLGKPAFLFAAPVNALIVGLFAPFMPARTRAGRREYLKLRGFEEFLGRTEESRFKDLDLPATTFEKYLPYAMALGVSDQWARLFRDMLTESPTWYTGTTGRFDSSLFTHRMGTMSSSLGTAMVSQPRSSSGSSGFSGGGFSGGGFGGGGGGAF
jgi:hypothetical protein